jgi:hypothetical protein
LNSVRVVNRLPQFVDERERRAVRAMVQVAILGASEASVMTPIDTSNLLNSQYREVEAERGRITGRVGYVAEYAAAVHDPDNPQNFRRATAEKEFLRKGFEQAEPEIRRVITGVLRA